MAMSRGHVTDLERPAEGGRLEVASRGTGTGPWVAAWCMAAVVLVARPSHAEPEEPIRVDYQAAAGCPDDALFLAQLRERTARWRIEHGAAPARRFEVVIRHEGNRVVGQLTVVGLSGTSARREIQGASCTEVRDALAVITALAIDPHAVLSRLAPAPTRPPAEASPAPPPPVAPEARRAPAPAWHLAAGSHAVGSGGLAPGLAPGLDAFVELGLSSRSPLAPSFRVSVRGYESAPIETVAGSARFARLLGGLEACPARVAFAGALALVPCAAFDVGGTSSTGEVPLGLHETRTFVDLGVTGHLDWSLSSAVALEVDGGALALALPYRFAFPGLSVYQTPMVAGFMGLGSSVRFW